MAARVHEGGFADTPLQSAKAFRSAMRAMARPGTIECMNGAFAPGPISEAAATLILVLCDPDTSVSLHGDCDSASARDWITFHTGAPIVSAADADFAVGSWVALQPVDRFRIGTPAYPDRSCTLIVERPELVSTGAALTGPGIKTVAYLNLPEASDFADNRDRFPLGFDCFFASGNWVAALPRSTRVTFDPATEAA